MPNPAEICTVSIGGSHFRDWTHVAVSREFGGDTAARATLRIVEKANGKLANWGALKVSIGDTGTLALAGKTVIDGLVCARQGSVDDKQKGVQVDFVSKTVLAVAASAPVKPGEFRNYSFEQIGRSLLGNVGVNLKTVGSVAGLSKKFEIFRVIPGESIFDALERLARFRNVFFSDDGQGNLLVGQGASGSAPSVIEGQNMKRGQLVMRNDDILSDKIQITGSRGGNDQVWGDAARQVSATTGIAVAAIAGMRRITAEMAGDKDDMRMRADHEAAATLAKTIACSVTVQGWHDQAGELWIEHVGKDILIGSDTLFPGGSMNLKVRAVVHAQDPGQDGTTTTIECCHEGGLGGGPRTNAGPGGGIWGAEPAKPDGDEAT